jgi:hypothetical protein
MALRIVKDHVLKARGEEGAGLADRMSAKEVWERLVGEMNGQARRAPSSKTVKRWLDRWVDDGVLVNGKPLPVEGQRKPAPSYTLPPSRARALPITTCLLSVVPSNPLQHNESMKGQGDSIEGGVRSSEGAQPNPDMNGHGPDQGANVRSSFPVPEGDLGDGRSTDNFTHIYKGDDLPAKTSDAPVDSAYSGDVTAPAEPPVLLEYRESEGEWDAAFGLGCPDEDTRLG